MTTQAAMTDNENSLPGDTRIIDCDSLVGRLRDICRGHDDAGNPVLTPRQCNAYRRSWGLGDLPNAEPTRKVHRRKLVQTRIDEHVVRERRDEPKPRREKPQRATLPPCVYLGDVVREEGCRLCGGRRAIAAVHGCSIHGECTQSNYGLKVPGRFMQTCITCHDYSEIGGLATVPKEPTTNLPEVP